MPDISINAFPARGALAASLTVPPPPPAGDILPLTLAVSVVLHAIVLLITFAPPDFPGAKFVPHLDVVLVNSKTAAKPVKADALAQANLDGGGNTEAERRAKTNLPKLNNVEPAPNVQLASRKVQRLEDEAQRLLQLAQGTHSTAASTEPAPELPREAKLDDPAAELDSDRLASLIGEVSGHSVQLIVTTLHGEFPAFGQPGRRFGVATGRVVAL